MLPLGDDDFEMLDIVGVSSADELGLTDADLIEVGRTAAIQAAQELAAAKEAASRWGGAPGRGKKSETERAYGRGIGVLEREHFPDIR